MPQQRAEKKDRYFVLHHYMLKTDAWKSLSAAARAVYLQLEHFQVWRNRGIPFGLGS